MTSMPVAGRGPRSTARSAVVAAFVAGGLAAALGIAVGELVAGLVSGAPSLVIAIGDLVIDLQPEGGKDLMVSLFGTNDKLALNLIIVAAAVLIAGLLGVAGRRDWTVAVVGFSIAGLVGLLAAVAQPLNDPLLSATTVVIAITAALVALRLMLLATNPAWAPTPATTDMPAGADGTMPDWDRRRFLQVGGGVAVSSIALGLVGRYLVDNRPGGAPVDTTLPAAAEPGPALPPGASLEVAGLTPLIVPNDEFYRIDTALVAPRVSTVGWTLRIHGMVDREVFLTYEDLQAMPLFEQFVTIACVSNEVGGDLVGNALWSGVDLREVLDMAGVQPGADQIVGRSVDAFTAGFPTAWAMDPVRRPMIALGMNGEPLPIDHGYPARLIIPGLFGYVSATKWLSAIELTTMDAFDGYWIPRGWAKEAPVLTQSRIDTPRPGSTVAVGSTVPIAGVAWAPDRGVRGVEIAVDDGPWQSARISDPLNDATWVQWLVPWQATEPGPHLVKVRATDGTGDVQTAEHSRPAPDGARGHHTITLVVS